jgi:hypothetical protein
MILTAMRLLLFLVGADSTRLRPWALVDGCEWSDEALSLLKGLARLAEGAPEHQVRQRTKTTRLASGSCTRALTIDDKGRQMRTLVIDRRA